MICGAAKRSITPPAHLLPELHGLGGITFSGVLDELYVRALALGDGERTVLFLVFDLDKVPEPEACLNALRERTGVPQEHISLLSIHTHTAPVAGWRPTEGPNFIENKPENVQKATHEYEALLMQRALEAAEAAMAARRPARIGWGRGESFVNVNRVQDYFIRQPDGGTETRVGLGQNPAAWVERGLFLLKVEDLQGNLIASLTNYAVHNCVMIGNRCAPDGGALLSADLGGNVSRLLEQAHPDSVALWVSGAAGDVNPVLSNEIFYPDPLSGAQTAYRLNAGADAPRMMLTVLAARHYADVARTLEQVTCADAPMTVGGAVEWLELPSRGTKPYQIRLHLTQLGPLAFWGVSGELYSSIGRALTESLPDGEHVICNHDASLMANTGYIFDDETLARDPEGMLPGRRNNEILAGYAKDALCSAAARLWSGRRKG